MNDVMSLSQKADALEKKMSDELDLIVIKSRLYQLADGDTGPSPNAGALMAKNPEARVLMGDDPRLPAMPEKPTLVDFFKYRFGPSMHLLQSARHAVKGGLSEKMVLACLLHDISMGALIRTDHGYWGAQLIAPYVDGEVAWAVEHHQALRFFADPQVDYEYPQAYVRFYGAGYVVPDYLQQAYERARRHRWYGAARAITLYDLYAFEDGLVIDPGEFEDLIGRHFRQPKEGLGFDGSPTAHMWRTMIWPNNFL